MCLQKAYFLVFVQKVYKKVGIAKVINWGSHDCQTQNTYPNLFIQSYDCGNFVPTKRIIIQKNE